MAKATRPAVLALGCLLIGASGAPEPRFTGLERLYFQRLDAPASVEAFHAAAAARLLPEVLPRSQRFAEPRSDEEAEDLFVQDFTLPPVVAAGELVLRQVIDRTHRISDQWWALYRDGRRTDLWFFTAHVIDAGDGASPRTGKALSSLAIERVLAPAADRLVLRVCGGMARPQGAWWTGRRDLDFTVAGGELRYRRALTRFSIGQGHDLGDGPPAPSATTERDDPEHPGRVAVRRLDSPTAAVLTACGFTDEADARDCDALEKIALCLTERPEARQTHRGAEEPTFIERGGGPR